MVSNSINSALEEEHSPRFVNVAHAQDGSGHSIGITGSGIAYSWGRSNELGQLGRNTSDQSTAARARTPTPVQFDRRDRRGQRIPRAVRAYAGGSAETGHSAVLDSNGDLWMAGCDRWQQLGLGSPQGGATGYTWGDGGKIWRDVFVRNSHLNELVAKNLSASTAAGSSHLHEKLVGFPPGKSSAVIRDVALGEDHTVVLSSNGADVYTFGKGSDGQLGYVAKPFVSAPTRSTALSSRHGGLSAVCAIKHCSLSINGKGAVVGKAGRCNLIEKTDALKACITRAENDGLLDRNQN